jgi:hypothetical protein
MNWETAFSQKYPEVGATDEELARLESTLFAPLSVAELRRAQKQAAGNPYPVTDPLYSGFRLFDPTQWRFPTAKLPESFLEFLRFSNGGEFCNGMRRLQFFSATHPGNGLRAMLLAYLFPEFMPMALPFAFDGGGTFYIFDLRAHAVDGEYPIVASAAGSLGWDPDGHWFVANTFVEACLGTTDLYTLRADN